MEAGYVSPWSVGIRVTLDDQLIHESHPGCEFLKLSSSSSGDLETQFNQLAAEVHSSKERWKNNRFCIFTDVGLALLFFIVFKFTDELLTSALIVALAGVGVAVTQRFAKVDLMGGLAVFGVFMLLFSAGFSILFQDDSIIQMKSTFLGLFAATIMLADVYFNHSRYFGPRFSRYLPSPVDDRRLILGMASLGITMATLNYVVVRMFSEEIWLYYTTFGDFVISLLFILGIIRFARLQKTETSTGNPEQ